MNNYAVPNLVKACELLKILADRPNGISAAEVEDLVQIPRTTAFRILKTLCSQGMVEKRKTNFFAGPGLFEIGLHALSKSDLRQLAVPLLQELTRKTGQTSHLAIPSGWHSLILEVCDSPDPVQVASRPGTLADLHCSATGKIFLSYLYKDHLNEYSESFQPKKRTDNTMTSYAELCSMIEQVRQTGFALDEEEYHPGVRCLAAGVRDMRNEIVAAMGVTGPVASFTKDKIEFVKECVLKASNTLSKSLGYKTE